MCLKIFALPTLIFMLINVLVLLAGSVLLGMGAHMVDEGRFDMLASYLAPVDEKASTKFLADTAMVGKALGISAIAVGLWLCVIGSVGVAGSLLGMRCLLVVYIILAITTVVAVCGVGIIIYASRDMVVYMATLGSKFGLRMYYDGAKPTKSLFTEIVDRTQIEMECCGVENYTDFRVFASDWEDIQRFVVPLSCCKLSKKAFRSSGDYDLQDVRCPENPTVANSNIAHPCREKILDWFTAKEAPIVGIFTLVVFFFSAMTVFALGVCLCTLVPG